MKYFIHYLIFAAIAVGATNVFAYKVRIKNDTPLSMGISLKAYINLAECDHKEETIPPGGETREFNLGACCIQFISIHNAIYNGISSRDTLAKQYYPPTTGADISCRDVDITAATDWQKSQLFIKEGIN